MKEAPRSPTARSNAPMISDGRLTRSDGRLTVAVRAAALCIVFAFGGSWPAPAQPATGDLFILSAPIGAAVIVDGKALGTLTPVLVRGLTAGSHAVTVSKTGYAPQTSTTTITAAKPQSAMFNLVSSSVVPRFPADDTVLINGRKSSYDGTDYKLPPGTYALSESQGLTSITAVYPNDSVLGALDVVAGGLVVTSGLLVADGVVNSSTTNVGDFAPVFVAAGVAALTDVLLHVKKVRYLAAVTGRVVAVPTASASDQDEYDKAQAQLSQGNLRDAADLYIGIITRHDDSVYYPRALYELAKVQLIQGDTILAQNELRLIVDKYQAPEVYDKACKSLADLAFRDADYKLSLDYLDKMVYSDPLFTRQQIADYRASIQARINGGSS